MCSNSSHCFLHSRCSLTWLRIRSGGRFLKVATPPRARIISLSALDQRTRLDLLLLLEVPEAVEVCVTCRDLYQDCSVVFNLDQFSVWFALRRVRQLHRVFEVAVPQAADLGTVIEHEDFLTFVNRYHTSVADIETRQLRIELADEADEQARHERRQQQGERI